MKDFSRWALLLSLAAISAMGGARAVAAEPPARITVTGTGVATAAPDVADVHAGVTHEDASAARAMQQADAAMRAERMAADAVIEPGEQELSAPVSVTFQIQP